ncbi:hypothetical protein DBZ45_02035 [Arthrobacter globiformis]|uniref:RNA polymerase sigma factor 70 region 4 type 2 domain-containing protein n=2 Tax=Arthrobacter globiformis TaxID=1665 RepID=A0A328HKA4_ARTGO|nr:hypothetical protein DBZ45_02035 [Arthrobacter globiformis]
MLPNYGGSSLGNLEGRDASLISMLNDHGIREALTELESEQRDVLVALHYCRLTVAEAAVQLGIPADSVTHRALAALRTLRRLLDQRSAGQNLP